MRFYIFIGKIHSHTLNIGNGFLCTRFLQDTYFTVKLLKSLTLRIKANTYYMQITPTIGYTHLHSVHRFKTKPFGSRQGFLTATYIIMVSDNIRLEATFLCQLCNTARGIGTI